MTNLTYLMAKPNKINPISIPQLITNRFAKITKVFSCLCSSFIVLFLIRLQLIPMFTGIVKLVQIDDYISPSQNCIQPKIIKKEQKVQKATVSLNDCLACSGCITSAQSVLVDQMSVAKFMAEVKNTPRLIVIVAPQVLLSLAYAYKMDIENVLAAVDDFMKNTFSAVKVYDLSEGIELCHEFIFEQYKSRGKVLCSECPGWICYAQKTLGLQVSELMSSVKSPQQVMGRIIKKDHKDSFVVSIMPCYDKKLEAIRFEIESGIKQVDLTLTTTQFTDMLKATNKQQAFRSYQATAQFKVNRLLIQNEQKSLTFLHDQTSNGYLQSLLDRLKVKAERKQIKNSDFVEYQFTLDDKKVKFAKCYGFRNIQKIVQSIKRKKCEYSYVEIMACPGGCYGGGGQIKESNLKSKQLGEIFDKLKESNSKGEGLVNNKILDRMANEQFTAIYKPIEKTLSQSVMNW